MKSKTFNHDQLTNVLLILALALIPSCKVLPEEIIDPADFVSQRSTQGIERDLEYLTYGLAMAHHDLYDTLAGGLLYNPISNIMYRKATQGVTDYYVLTYEYLLNEAEANDIELDSMMNVHIRAEFGINDTSNLVRLILANNYHNGTNFQFHIVFPYLDHFVNLEPDEITELIPMTEAKFSFLNAKRPVWSWSYSDKVYPLGGFGVTGLGDWEEMGDVLPIGLPRPLVVSAFTPLPVDLYFFDYIDSDEVIIDCIVQAIHCKECPFTSTDTPVDDEPGAFAGDDEIYIVLYESGSKGGCYSLTIPIDLSVTPDWLGNTYATIQSLPQFDYYYATPGAVERDLLKMNNTLFSEVSDRWGKYLTLCNEQPRFKVVGELFEDEEIGYNLARGGVYELKLPGVTKNPIYFSFPFAQYFWYGTGPDMRIHYTLHWDGSSLCTDSEVLDVTHNQFTSLNIFLDNNILDPGNNRYIASTDLNEITAYWEDCWLYVGVSPDNYLNEEHVIAFEAVIDPAAPDVPVNLGEEIGSLLTKTGILPDHIDGGGETLAFEITQFLHDMAEIEYDENYIVYVDAEFENGERIHQYVELTYTDMASAANTVKTFFRGNLADMEIRIYEAL